MTHDELRQRRLAEISEEHARLVAALSDPAAAVDFRRLAFVRRVLAANVARVLGEPSRDGAEVSR